MSDFKSVSQLLYIDEFRSVSRVYDDFLHDANGKDLVFLNDKDLIDYALFLASEYLKTRLVHLRMQAQTED